MDEEERPPERRRPRTRPYQGTERRHPVVVDPSPSPVVNGNAPPWLRAAVYLGVPSVIALFLVYAVTLSLGHRLTAIDEALVRLELHLRQVCVLAADTDDERARCLQ